MQVNPIGNRIPASVMILDPSDGGVRSSAPEAVVEAPARQTENPFELSPEEQQVVLELQIRDREVRAHEQAHLAAAGPYAKGGPNYQYVIGPDGRQYAVGGEVQIDVSPGRTPEETLQKAEVIRSAAMAVANPSASDRAIAAAASQMAMEARQEIALKRIEMMKESQKGNNRYLPFQANQLIGQTIDVGV